MELEASRASAGPLLNRVPHLTRNNGSEDGERNRDDLRVSWAMSRASRASQAFLVRYLDRPNEESFCSVDRFLLIL